MFSTQTHSPHLSVLPIQVQASWLMIDAAQVREILGPQTLVRVPGAPADVPGVIFWRDNAVAVLDLGARLELKRGVMPDSRTRTVILQIGEALLALIIDGAREVQDVSFDELRAPANATEPLISFEMVKGNTVTPILDLQSIADRVLSSARGSLS
jgi:chemotaxis signal transduction protein